MISEALGTTEATLRMKRCRWPGRPGGIHMGTMAGEVEGADAGDDADGLAQGVHVHAGRGLVGELPLEGSVDATREVDGLTAAGDLAEGVAVGLAALTHDASRSHPDAR